MSQLDVIADIPIAWDSIPFNPALMGEQITSSNWFLIHGVWIKYTSADDFNLNVNFRRKDVSSTKTFTVKAIKTFMKFQLPPGQICNEFTIGITAAGITTAAFEVQSIGVLWKPIAVGTRG